MIEEFKNDILGCVDVLTENDYLYFKENNTAMVLLKQFIYDSENFYMLILDEKYPDLVRTFNKVKERVKPSMANLTAATNITSVEINNIVKLFEVIVAPSTISELIMNNFANTKDLLAYYDIAESEPVEDYPYVDDSKDFSEDLKDNIIKYVLPECKSIKLDMIEIKAAEKEVASKVACQEVGRIVKSYEAKLSNLAEDMESLSEKATTAETEIKIAKKEASSSKEELVDKAVMIKALEEKLGQANKDLDIALQKIDILTNAPKIIDDEDILEDSDILECATFMRTLSGEEIKSILLKFMQDDSASAASKSPFVLQMFEYIMSR